MKYRRLLLLVGLCALAAYAAAADKTVYITSRWGYMNRIETVGFAIGYDIEHLEASNYSLSRVATEIASMNPRDDALIVVCDDEREFDDVAIKVSRFVREGGKVFWLFSSYYVGQGDTLNEILRDRFGIMVDNLRGYGGELRYDGGTLCSLWDSLYIGVPDAINRGIKNNIVLRDESAVDRTIVVGDRERVTSAVMRIGEGTVWFAVGPYYHYGGSPESDKSMFSDYAIDLYENRDALAAICDWLSQ